MFALLQRFYDPQFGRILIDGQDIARVTQESLRESIGVVPQDISMFHRSVMENIRYGRPDASDDEVREAAIAARCDFIDDLQAGMRTIVGDRGVKLSGGQRQRIAIARAFLKGAPLLLLDEATSALDSESEEVIREALGRLMRGRTVIAIAHRLSTVRNFDRIIVLQTGRISQDGPPDHLVGHEGLYRQLVQDVYKRQIVGDDGRATGHGFDHHESERLGPVDRNQQCDRAAQELRFVLVIDLADILDISRSDHRLDHLVEILAIGNVDLGGDL